MFSFQYQSNKKGFTLIELMIVIVLIGIFAGMATPAVSHFIKKQRISSDMQSFTSSIIFARSEAIRLNTRVFIIPAQVRSNGKVNAPNSLKWSEADAILVYKADGSEYQYKTGSDLRVTVLNKNVGVKIGSMPITDTSGTTTTSDKLGLTFLPSGLMRIKQDYSVAGNGEIGKVARVQVSNKDYGTTFYYTVARIEGNGRAKICRFSPPKDKDKDKDKDTFCEFKDN